MATDLCEHTHYNTFYMVIGKHLKFIESHLNTFTFTLLLLSHLLVNARVDLCHLVIRWLACCLREALRCAALSPPVHAESVLRSKVQRVL